MLSSLSGNTFQHLQFHVFRLIEQGCRLIVQIDMAGCTDQAATTFCDDLVDVILYSGIHDAVANPGIDRAYRAVSGFVVKYDFLRHVSVWFVLAETRDGIQVAGRSHIPCIT